MDIQATPDGIRIALSRSEVHLFRRTLERASFIDTPAAEQPDILAFCSAVLEALPTE